MINRIAITEVEAEEREEVEVEAEAEEITLISGQSSEKENQASERDQTVQKQPADTMSKNQ